MTTNAKLMQSQNPLPRPKVSVVIPVYNVAAWIERCVDSLMAQTLDEIEFIFVDDCTPDDSMDIVRRTVARYPQRQRQVRCLSNQHNIGVFFSRISGQLEARGEYIACVDADDYVESETYAALYAQAQREQADCVVTSYSRDYADHSETACRVYPETDGRDLMRHLYRYPMEMVTWGAMVRNDERLRSLLNKYNMKPEWQGTAMWEDVAVMMPYYYGTRRIAYCDRPLYHYNRANVSSALNNISEAKARQALHVMRHLRQYFKDDAQMTFSIGLMTLGAKNMLLGTITTKEWRETERWCNRHIMRYTSIPLKVRVFYWLMAHGCDWAYKLYAKRKQ